MDKGSYCKNYYTIECIFSIFSLIFDKTHFSNFFPNIKIWINQDKIENFGKGKWTGLLYRSELKFFTSLKSPVVDRLESLSDPAQKIGQKVQGERRKVLLKWYLNQTKVIFL